LAISYSITNDITSLLALPLPMIIVEVVVLWLL